MPVIWEIRSFPGMDLSVLGENFQPNGRCSAWTTIAFVGGVWMKSQKKIDKSDTGGNKREEKPVLEGSAHTFL